MHCCCCRFVAFNDVISSFRTVISLFLSLSWVDRLFILVCVFCLKTTKSASRDARLVLMLDIRVSSVGQLEVFCSCFFSAVGFSFPVVGFES